MRYYKLASSLLWLAFYYTLATNSYGQTLSSAGARSSAMAGTSLLIEDEFAVFNNPAALKARSLSIIGAYNTQYIGLGITNANFGLVMPFEKFTSGFGVHYIGDELLNQLDARFGTAHDAGFASFGMSINYHQYYLRNYGYRRTYSIDAGGKFSITDEFSLGILLRNLTRSGIDGESSPKLSSILAVGLSYHPIEQFSIDLQVNKNIDLPLSTSVGIEYLATEVLSLRTGFSPSNNLGSLGAGLAWDRLRFDIAGQYHALLGFSGSFSFIISRK